MSEAQYITFILGFAATIAAILIALLINNARLNDTKEALRAELKAGDSETRAELKAGDSEILAQIAESYHLAVVSRTAELDNRVTQLERSRRNPNVSFQPSRPLRTSLPLAPKIMREAGWPVVFDATHSVQLPGAAGESSGGRRVHRARPAPP